MDLAVSEFRLDGRRMFVGIARDISERKRAEQTFKFLADASATLAALVDYESTLQRVARLAVPFFADWCAVDMLENDGSLRRVAVVHADARKGGTGRRNGTAAFLPGSTPGPGAADVLRTGRSEIVPEVGDEVLSHLARDADHLGGCGRSGCLRT